MAIYEGEIFICKVLKRNFKKCEKRRQLGGIHKMDTELSRKSDIKSYSLDNLTKHFYIYAKCELKLFSPKTSKKCESWILGGVFSSLCFRFLFASFSSKRLKSHGISRPQTNWPRSGGLRSVFSKKGDRVVDR